MNNVNTKANEQLTNKNQHILICCWPFYNLEYRMISNDICN